jgi:HD superfamily phosphohydrolase
MAQKLFRDPLYDYIPIEKDSWLLYLINTPEVQRLRYISQLGLAHFTYPGATHSRFSHSLGVFNLMQVCISHLKKDCSDYFQPLDEDALLAAALLHDIGHFPLSHVTEATFGRHEEQGIAIINNSESGVNKILTRRHCELPSKVVALLSKSDDALPWQRSLISSQLDVDRLDYLQRDSLCSGAGYGHFDWFRIIHTMELREKQLQGAVAQKVTFVVWPEKSKYAIEEYIFSRFYMYQSVYFHHTIRGFEELVRKVLQRAKDIAVADVSFATAMLPPIKSILRTTDEPNLETFQMLTDNTLFAQIELWQDSKDKVLSDLCERLLLRKGVGWHELKGTPFEMTEKIEQVRKYLNEKGLDSKYYFYEGKTETTAYKPYSSAAAAEEQSSVNSIILFDDSWPGTGFVEISEAPGLERIKAITGSQVSTLRYYFPKEHEREIKALLD